MKNNIIMFVFCTLCLCVGLLKQKEKVSVVTCKDSDDMITYYNSVRNYMIDAQLTVYENCQTRTIANFKFKEIRQQYLNTRMIQK